MKKERNANMLVKCTFPVLGGPKSNIPFQGDNRPVKYLELHKLEREEVFH
jgi:hypothetical protein